MVCVCCVMVRTCAIVSHAVPLESSLLKPVCVCVCVCVCVSLCFCAFVCVCVCVCVCLGVRVVMTLYYLGNVEVRSDEFRRVFLNPRVG